MKEYESTISKSISRQEFMKVKNDVKYRIDLIFLFSDGRTRMSNRILQFKTITYKRDTLGRYKNQWYPITRTVADEQLAPIPDDLDIHKVIYRLIVHENDNIRISYNKELCDGEKYYVEYEIEYSDKTTYEEIVANEYSLMSKAFDNNHFIDREILTMTNIFAFGSTGMESWECFDDLLPYKWAFKYNGTKTKIFITNQMFNDGSYLVKMWMDASNTTSHKGRGKNLHLLHNLCISGEKMEDEIIIFEILGSMTDGIIYTTEPHTTIDVLDYLSLYLEDVFIDTLPIKIQKFFPAPMPDTYPETICDGIIIYQQYTLKKWKIPTINIICIDGNIFQLPDETFISLTFVGTKGIIYEMSCDFKILRNRNDRITLDDKKEYDIFMKASKTLMGNELFNQLLQAVKVSMVKTNKRHHSSLLLNP